MTTDPAADLSQPTSPRCLGYAVAAAVLLSFGLVVASYLSAGTNAAIKVVTGLAMPVGLLWLFFFICGVWWAKKKRGGASLLFFAIWLTVGVLFNGRVGQAMIAMVEAPMSEYSEDTFPLRAVVVLGGGASVNQFGTDELNGDGERVMSAAQMWHAGQVNAIICTGGVGDPVLDGSSVGRRLLKSVGVPDAAIVELPGFNTVEEMQSLKKLFESPPEVLRSEGKVGLITSAFHMNRAMRLANSKQLDFLPFPACYRNSAKVPLRVRDLIPQVGGGYNVAIALKEWLAWLAGR